MCWACLVFFVFVLWLLTLQADTREALLASPIWFAILAVAYGWKGRRAATVATPRPEDA
jgi:D-serine/D-alanine/glycine transporter